MGCNNYFTVSQQSVVRMSFNAVRARDDSGQSYSAVILHSQSFSATCGKEGCGWTSHPSLLNHRASTIAILLFISHPLLIITLTAHTPLKMGREVYAETVLTRPFLLFRSNSNATNDGDWSPMIYARLRGTPLRCTPMRGTPMRSTPIRATSIECTPRRGMS